MTIFTKERIETLKTVIIAVLLTGIVAFVGGAKYQANHASQVKAEAQSLAATLKSASR